MKALCEDVENDNEESLSPDSACSAESDQIHSDQAQERKSQLFPYFCPLLLYQVDFIPV